MRFKKNNDDKNINKNITDINSLLDDDRKQSFNEKKTYEKKDFSENNLLKAERFYKEPRKFRDIKSVFKKKNGSNHEEKKPLTAQDIVKENKRTKRIKKNMTAMVVIFVLMFVSLIGYTSYSMAMYGSKWFASPYNTRVKHQKDKITPGDIYDVNGLVMATADSQGNRTYPQSEEARKANAHVLGDQYGITSGGAEALYSKYIYGFNLNAIDRIVQAFKAQKSKGNDVTLTVDSDLNKYIYEQMSGKTGAVVVMNYKTGAIIGSVSRESFDINKVQELAKEKHNSEESFFLNKVTMGKYPPGSTFKLITAVSALENMSDAATRTYNSSSDITMNGEKITNFDRDSHGNINLENALKVSSNTYFAQLARDLGKSNLTKTAENFGFNSNFMYDDVIMASSSYNGGKTDNQLAWSSVGQHQDLVTPLHMCMIVSAIANNGQMMEPKNLLSVKDSLGSSIYTMRPKKVRQVTSPEIAKKMQAMMKGVVESGTGRNAAVKGLTIGGKTGSAETGKSTHAWFVGYIESEQTPYAVAIVLENAGTGGKNAAPLASKIFARMTGK